jgi:DHA3 family macrolide efflux protein-like MFS transporter
METQPSLNSLRNYLLIWFGQNLSLVGSTISTFSLIWYLLTVLLLTPVLLGILSLSSLLPLILIPIFGGALSDILNRRIFLIVFSTLKILVVFILLLYLTYGGGVLLIIIFLTFLYAIPQAFILPSFFSIMPSLVPQKQYGRINGLNYLAITLISTFSPAAASIFFSLFSVPQLLFGEIIFICLSIIPLIFIKIPKTNALRLKEEEKNPVIQYIYQIVDGFKSSVSKPGFLIIFASYIAFYFIIETINPFLSYFFQLIHSSTAFEFAIFNSFNFFGMILGSILAIVKKYWKPAIVTFILTSVLVLLGYITFALAPFQFFLLLFITNFIIGVAFTINYVIFYSIMQTNIPKRNLGQIFGVYLTISNFSIYVFYFLIGSYLMIFSVTTFFLLSSIVGILIFIGIFVLIRILKIKYENYIEII